MGGWSDRRVDVWVGGLTWGWTYLGGWTDRLVDVCADWVYAT